MADQRHKRETDARRKPKAAAIIGPLAVLATASAVTIGVLTGGSSGVSGLDQASAGRDLAPGPVATSSPAATLRSEAPVTRSADRVQLGGATAAAAAFMSKAAIEAAVDSATQHRWTTDELNLWTRPGAGAKQVGEVVAGRKVLVTGRSIWGRSEIVVKHRSRWVTASYLSEDKPPGVGAGLSDQACPDGSVENGLTDRAVFVYRSVCHAFPQITSYGGWDAHGEHSSGRALDVMTSDVTLGTAIAEFLQAHAGELDLFDIIWRQHIWTPVRSSEGWRSMPSRGSATANHYDHVHVSVY